MKYRIIWRPHKIYYTKVLIRFYMSLTFQQFTWPKAEARLAMSMNHDQTWLNGILSWDKKQTSYSFLFPEFLKSSLILYSPVSGGSCVVWQSCCECETVAVSLWIRFYQIQSLLSRFLGENITTTAITHYLVTADWWIDKLQPITVFSHLFDKYIWPCATFTFWHNNEIKEEMLLVVC